MRKAHAEHNERLCILLLKDGSFNDWVVTTAFYSAVNFVKHQIFPLNYGGTKYADFDSYIAFLLGQKPNVNPHKTLIELTRMHLINGKKEYRWLHDQCHTARYNNYIVSEDIAKEAKNKLDHIKSVCSKP